MLRIRINLEDECWLIYLDFLRKECSTSNFSKNCHDNKASRLKSPIFLGNRLIILRKSCNKLSVILLEIERYTDTISWKSRTTYQSLRGILKLEFKVNSNILRSLENFHSSLLRFEYPSIIIRDYYLYTFAKENTSRNDFYPETVDKTEDTLYLLEPFAYIHSRNNSLGSPRAYEFQKFL